MKLTREYLVEDEILEPVRRVALKGIGAVVVLFILILLFATFLRPQAGQGGLIFDAVSIGVLVLTIQTYSRSTAVVRIELARKATDPAVVIGLLVPFARPGFGGKSRFDITGEAHYMLLRTAEKLGEKELAAYCRAFILRFRRGDYADKIRRS